MTDQDVMDRHPPQMPGLRLIWTAIVDVDGRSDLGPSRGGHRYIVPISGGRFYGAEGFEALTGDVMAGGADRQFLRSDGVKELEALYEMRCDSDGAVITVRNRVVVDETRAPNRYAQSVIEATVCEGPHGWLNRRLLIGTLQTARPERQAVVIRAWGVDL